MQRLGELLPSKVSSSEHLEPSRNSSATSSVREIAALVTRLLGHYWTADEPAAVRQAQIEDWLEDLREYPSAVVAEACKEWRRTQSRRPTPADIRQLCLATRAEQQERLSLASPTDMDAYARSVGWSSEAERLAAIAEDERRKAENDARWTNGAASAA